jgi:GNAT superfamily N-acetyltransferase
MTLVTTAGVVVLDVGVQHSVEVGVLAYVDDVPVGWCSIAPRQCYPALDRYRALPRIDDRPVWSITCFFVGRRVRGRGVTLALLRAAVAYAGSLGCRIVEGYPVEPGARLHTSMGAAATVRTAGFRDVTPQGQARMVMRIHLDD